MAAFDSVRQKIYRARDHGLELHKRLSEYYETDPGDMIESVESTRERPHYVYAEKHPIPARLALVFGDCLQNMRSALDYLVWELVEHAGNQPTERNMFPICLKESEYKNAVVKRQRLLGLTERDVAHVDSLQPYRLDHPESSPLAILERLTNINKHRRVIFTGLVGTTHSPPIRFPHMKLLIRNIDANGGLISEIPFWAFLGLQERLVEGMEITIAIDQILRHVTDVVLPLFQHGSE